MNIVYIGAFRLPNLDAAAPRVLNNAKAMREARCNVKFISWGGKYREQDFCEDGKYRVCGFEYVISGDLPIGNSVIERVKTKLTRGQKSIKILQKMEKPDLIILYNADNAFSKKMLKYCNMHNIKLANDMNEWYANNELHLPDILSNFINMKKTQRKILNKIVISSFLNNYYPDSNNIIVPPLCDRSEIKWDVTIEDERIKPFNGVTLIYAGTPAKKDCIHSVVNAVNQLATEGEKVRFIILGITRENYLKEYSQWIMDKELHENVLFLGHVSQDLIPAYYKKADFMVLLRKPNRKSMAGFPTKFAESMTAGIPVITNSTSDLPQYVANNRTGFMADGYLFDDIMKVIKEKVLTLSRENIEKMKMSTQKESYLFDFHSYVGEFKEFFKRIK
ncbi:glycosyltransferase [Parabacteroides sp.]